MTGPTRGATAATWWPWLVLPAGASALVASGLVLGAATGAGFAENVELFLNAPLAIGFSAVAASIWATGGGTAGLGRLAALYALVGLASALVLPASAWAQAASLPGANLPGGPFAAWLSDWVWALGAAPLMGLGLVLYPDGRLPGRRWWPAAAAGLAATVMLAVSAAVSSVEPTPLWDAVGFAGFLLLLASAAAGVAALAVRFLGAAPGSDVRGQIGAFLLAGAMAVIVAALPDRDTTIHLLLALAVGVALPATVASAVVHHGLLDPQAELAARLEAVTASRRTLVTEREEERVRLRRDLHDGLGPSLAAIGLGLRQLQSDIAGTPQNLTVTALADEVQRAVAEVRRICGGLRPQALNELGLVAAVTAATERLGPMGGPAICVHATDIPQLPPAQEVAAYRVLMEAITNAIRHAGARQVAVRMRWDGGLVAEVEDDGVGIEGSSRPGVGLGAMADRTDELGGRTTISSSGGGTLVRLWLPEATS